MLPYKLGFLEGFRRWRGSILAPQRNPDLQGSYSLAKFRIGVNKIPPYLDTLFANPLEVRQFKGLIAQCLYRSFGSKRLRCHSHQIAFMVDIEKIYQQVRM